MSTKDLLRTRLRLVEMNEMLKYILMVDQINDGEIMIFHSIWILRVLMQNVLITVHTTLRTIID